MPVGTFSVLRGSCHANEKRTVRITETPDAFDSEIEDDP